MLAQTRIAADHDWPGARSLLGHALELDPANSRGILMQAVLEHASGDQQRGIALMQLALERDPLNLLNRRYLGRMYYSRGRLDEAEATLRAVLDMNGSYQAAHYELGRILLAKGQVAAAVAAFEAESDASWRLFGLPLGYHAAGRTEAANAALADLLRNSTGSEYQVAETYGFFGDADRAIDWLNRAIDSRDGGILWLRGDPLLRAATRDPRYQAVLARLRYPPL